MKKNRIYDISLTAIFTAIIAVISQFYIITPLGIPLTFQIFAIALAGYVLDVKFSLLSVLCYILLGLIGIPVFSGFVGGVQHFFGATGGFVFGFLILALFCGIFKCGKKRILCGIIGLLLCHIIGVVQFSFVSASGIVEALFSISLPYLIKDFVLLLLAYLLADRFKNIISKIR